MSELLRGLTDKEKLILEIKAKQFDLKRLYKAVSVNEKQLEQLQNQLNLWEVLEAGNHLNGDGNEREIY